MRKTKIICTMGPSTDKEGVMEELAQIGMNVARFNFSHADHEEHLGRLKRLRRIRKETGLPIAALLDTKGPEIRLGNFIQEKVTLRKGQTFTLTTRDLEGTEEIVSISYKGLKDDVKTGMKILIDDGLVELEIDRVEDSEIICTVKNDGVISNHKGVNVPGASLSMPFISDKDRDDIVFGIQKGYDFIATSFTRTAQDVVSVRKILEDNNCDTINIIAKIENLQGVENIDEIIEVADGIMIARGDMGVEIPNEDVPVIQKMIIKKVYKAGKVVITATQMLDSMIKNPRPTRAETTDVANAIYDGTSAIMLSGETAAGLYPQEALRTMIRIAERTEADIDYIKRFNQMDTHDLDITEAICNSTCNTAHKLRAKAIITVTKSGRTARSISKYRPNVLILGCTTSVHVYRHLGLSWGVTPMLLTEQQDTFALFEHAVDEAEKDGYVEHGNTVVITAGVPVGTSGTTNLLKVHVVGQDYE